MGCPHSSTKSIPYAWAGQSLIEEGIVALDCIRELSGKQIFPHIDARLSQTRILPDAANKPLEISSSSYFELIVMTQLLPSTSLDQCALQSELSHPLGDYWERVPVALNYKRAKPSARSQDSLTPCVEEAGQVRAK